MYAFTFPQVFFLTFYFILKNLICSAVCGNAVTCPVRKGTRGRLGSTTKTGESYRARREESLFLNCTRLEKTCILGMNLIAFKRFKLKLILIFKPIDYKLNSNMLCS